MSLIHTLAYEHDRRANPQDMRYPGEVLCLYGGLVTGVNGTPGLVGVAE